MIRTLILFALVQLGVMSAHSQSKYALVVGIGDYPSSSQWSKIHGDNDVQLVTDALARLDFRSENIRTLKNSNATKRSILKQLEWLASVAKRGDYVYFHFSGHGQRVVDVNHDELTDPYDQSIIPYDARKYYQKGAYEGENHIIDDQLYIYLDKIHKAIDTTGTLYVVLDACHSGDASRSEDDHVFTRGANEVFQLPQPNLPTTERATPSEINWVEISACLSYQTNYECQIEAQYYGSLSYALYKIVTDSNDQSAVLDSALLDNVLSEVINSNFIIQTPSITFPAWGNTNPIF